MSTTRGGVLDEAHDRLSTTVNYIIFCSVLLFFFMCYDDAFIVTHHHYSIIIIIAVVIVAVLEIQYTVQIIITTEMNSSHHFILHSPHFVSF
mmetsp:Transcript_19617/g.19955  ORF Transcript_19617/g.19955 Transcript_19617/m.19955 type:complete len:92 (+) Transcript_19617:294-569(+)